VETSRETGRTARFDGGSRRSRSGLCLLLFVLVACQRSDPPSGSNPGAAAAGPPVAAARSDPALPGAPDIPALVAKVTPVVVNVTVEQTVPAPARRPFDWPDLFPVPPGGGQQNGPGDTDEQVERITRGSGFIIDPVGHVVTNAHVVEGAERVRVKLFDGRDFRARVRGRDRHHDVAVLELEGATGLPAAALGSSEALLVGEYVVAIGNPFGLGHTVTFGIVSAKSRSIGAGPYNDFLQTDAAINPGNSGGPLFDMRGEVVGINTAIAAQGSGIGFAITIGEVREIFAELIEKGYVVNGRLAVVVQAIDWPLARALGLERPEGALVTEVERGSQAERAGLRAGDVIVAVDHQPILHWQELPRVIAHRASGTRVILEVVRDKRHMTVEATIERLEDDRAEPSRPLVERAEDLGIQVEDARGGGALVRRVIPGSLAYSVVEENDVILEINRAPVSRATDFERIVRSAPSKSTLLFKLRREDRILFVAIDIP
jgi:serine protease Do